MAFRTALWRTSGFSGWRNGSRGICRQRLLPALRRPYRMFSFNPIRLKDKNMQQIKVLQRPLRV
ncbi:hypothetical protein GOB08_16120 [Sinorhizobium meliloti]|nr:hypothetical protein [Sinorhizobium meliloti]